MTLSEMAQTVPTLETERLTLGPLSQDHFQPMADFYASERAQFVGGPMDPEQTWRTLALEIGHWALRGYGRFAVTEKASGRMVGVIGPWNPHGWPEPEIGWDLMNGFEGKGYATEAARAALDHAYRDLGWTTAISLVAKGNDGSRRVAERLGARFDREFTHVRFGLMDVMRHAGPGGAA
ncbi:MAG: GNAT family N-acetyltransferase [Pseudomonadota bacterium]